MLRKIDTKKSDKFKLKTFRKRNEPILVASLADGACETLKGHNKTLKLSCKRSELPNKCISIFAIVVFYLLPVYVMSCSSSGW